VARFVNRIVEGNTVLHNLIASGNNKNYFTFVSNTEYNHVKKFLEHFVKNRMTL